jgi:hypothetical protein
MEQNRFLPWIGDEYNAASQRLLVVGISHYETPGDEYPEFTREIVEGWVNHNETRGLPYFTKLMTALTGAPGHVRKEVYSRLAFMNFCQTYVSGVKVSPTKQQWERGREAFVETLAELRPTHILATGITLWDELPPFSREIAVSGFGPKEIGIYSVGGNEAVATYMKHPSSYAYSGAVEHVRILPFLQLVPPFGR